MTFQRKPPGQRAAIHSLQQAVARLALSGGSVDFTTAAGGDNMKMRAPDTTDTTDVTNSSSAESIAAGQNTIVDDGADVVAIGNAVTVTSGIDVVAIGDDISVAPIFSNASVESVYILAEGPIVQISDDGVAIGDGPVLMYPTKPDDTAWADGDTAGSATWTDGASAEANDMIAIGDGAACSGVVDLIAIGDGATAMGMSELIAIGTSIAGIGADVFGGDDNDERFRRTLPDTDCVAIGRAMANGLHAVAIGGSAIAGRDVLHLSGSGEDWESYSPQENVTAIGSGAQAGVPDAALSVAGVNNATALGAAAVAANEHATALGAGAATTEDNQIMLGTDADFVEIPGNGSANGLVLTDTADGTRYIVQITSRALVVNPAP